MATTIRELLVSVGLDVDTDSVDVLTDRIDIAKQNLASFGRQLLAGVTTLATYLGATSAAAAETASFADRIFEQANQVGIGVEAMQELTFASEKLGGEGDDVVETMATLADRILDVQQGAAAATEDFALLDITLADVKGADPEELFLTMADAIASAEDPTKRLGAASRILGDDLVNKMIPLLRRGRDGIAGLREEARQLGIIMSEESVESARQFNSDMKVMQALFRSLRQELGLALIPNFREAAAAAIEWARGNRELINTRIEEFANRFFRLVEALVDGARSIDDWVQKVGGWEKVLKILGAAITALTAAGALVKLVTLFQSIAALAGPLITMITKLAAGGFGVLFAKVIAVVAALSGLFLIAEDFFTFLQGGDSVFGRLLQKFDKGGELTDALKDAWVEFQRTAKVVLEELLAVWSDVWPVLKVVAVEVFNFLKPFIVNGIRGFIVLLKGFAKSFADQMKLVRKIIKLGGDQWEFWTDQLSRVWDLVKLIVGAVEDFDPSKITGMLGRAGRAAGAGASAVGSIASSTIGTLRDQAASAVADVTQDNRTEINVQSDSADPKEVASEVADRMEERDRENRRQAAQAFSGREV